MRRGEGGDWFDDLGGRLAWADQRCCRLRGREQDGPLGKSAAALWADAGAAALEAAMSGASPAVPYG